MKRKLIPLAIILSLLIVLFIPIPANAAYSLYEYYVTGDDAYKPFYAGYYEAQTFTIDPESHSISRVAVLIFRESTPGTFTLSIQGVDDDGDPDNIDLASGTLDGDTLSTDTGGVWYVFNLTSEISEAYGETFAIVLKAEAGTSDAICGDWRYDSSSPSYSGGSRYYSTNSGATWTEDTASDFMFQVYGESLIDVDSAKVFRGYLEDDDMLFVLQYNNVYVPYYDNEVVSQYFDIQLTSSDGSTVLASTACRQWGYMPGSIYLSADSAASLTPGSTYRLYIAGVSDEAPSAYYQLQTTDWLGSDLTNLDDWVMTTAAVLEDYYDVDLIDVGSTGENDILNDEGSVVFIRGISGLRDVRPNLFEVVTTSIEYEDEEWTNALEESRDIDTALGEDIMEAADEFGGWFGLSGEDTMGFIIAAVYLALVVLITAVGKGNAAAGVVGMALAFPIILWAIWVGAINAGLIAVVVAGAVWLLVYSFWWGRS